MKEKPFQLSVTESLRKHNIVALYSVKPKQISMINQKKNFKVQVIINNSLDTLLADTGTHVSVCGIIQAKKWNLLSMMVPSNCTAKPNIQQPINMIDKSVSNDEKDLLQKVLLNFLENFSNSLGKLRHHQVQLHVDRSVKPVAVPPRTIPYHLKARAEKVIQEMLNEDVIEVHPTNQPAPWVSGAVIVPKPKTDGEIRISMDARNVNKAIQSNNLPIPRKEDIRAKLAGSRVFSKLDFISAFWQLELHPDSRYLTVFQFNDKLLHYKRLTWA